MKDPGNITHLDSSVVSLPLNDKLTQTRHSEALAEESSQHLTRHSEALAEESRKT